MSKQKGFLWLTMEHASSIFVYALATATLIPIITKVFRENTLLGIIDWALFSIGLGALLLMGGYRASKEAKVKKTWKGIGAVFIPFTVGLALAAFGLGIIMGHNLGH